MRKSVLCIGSFPRTIVFGVGNESEFHKDKSFIIDLSIVTDLYKAVTKILLQLKNDEKLSDVFQFATVENKTYHWKVSDSEMVDLVIKADGKIVFQISLDYPQFNELLYAISESILPILCLKNCDIDFFQYILRLELPIRELVAMANEIEKFDLVIMKSSFVKEKYRYFTIFKLNFDIVFILNKLKNFIVHDLLPNNAESLLKAIQF